MTKIIAVPHSDPLYNHYHTIDELPSHIFDEMKHFFRVYKELENKPTAVESMYDRNRAEEIIAESIKHYNEIYGREE